MTHPRGSATPTLQEQARALGDPTRYSIFRYLADAAAPVDVAELTGRFALNHNAIRQHLAKLMQAGLVMQDQTSSRGRGRPRLNYRIHPGAESRWDVTGPYERLSLLLGELLRTGDSAVDVGRRAGLRRALDTQADDGPVEFVVRSMEREGFDPVARGRGTKVDVVLRTCPFETAALAHPDTICSLHLGMAHGIAERTGGAVVVDELVAHDPRRANCRLRLRVASEDER